MDGGSAYPAANLIAHLRPYQRIGLDTSIFIYHLEAHPRYLPLTRPLLAAVRERMVSAVTSTVTLMEVTVRPWQLGQEGVARQYEAMLNNFPNLRIVDVSREVARCAAQLRAKYRVRPADALQVGTALIQGADAFVTNDRFLSRLTAEIDILLLDMFLPLYPS